MDQINGFNVIHTYTRAQAISDGVLIDITDFAKPYGYVVPVAITATLFNGYVKPNKELEKVGQSIEGRLHDLLMLLLYRIRTQGEGKAILNFSVDFVMKANPYKTETVEVIAEYHPGDNGEPVMTIMLEEDQ